MMEICSNPNLLVISKVVFKIIEIITISIPIMVIIVGMIDFFKTVTSDDPDFSKTFKIFSKRLFAAILVFLVIPIVTFSLETLVPNSNVTECLIHLQDGNEAEGEVDAVDETEEEEAPVVSENVIEENKTKCEQENKTYIKMLKSLVPEEIKTTDYYLESGNYSYICTDGEVE